MEKGEILEKIALAETAFRAWSETTARERAKILKNIAENIRRNRTKLAEIITNEQGKPPNEAEAEIEYGASYFDWSAEEAPRVYGRVIPSTPGNAELKVTYEPLGVVATITPWNFPHAMLARKVAAALAAGCTVISKPAPETPQSALELERVCTEAGLPKAAFQVVTGDAEMIGDCFMDSTTIKKLSFTGSTEVGKLLMRKAANTVKKLTLELGGNAPFIVFDDCDLNKAVEGALAAKFRNCGQTCISANRFLVQEGIVDKFTKLLTDKLPTIELFRLINQEAYDKVNNLVKDAISKGAKVVYERSPLHLLTGINDSMQIAQTEIFGPVIAIQTFKTEEEALQKANSTQAGLAAYFFTENAARLRRIAKALQFGMVGVNTTRISMVEIPFGGIKQSGFGREGGSEGIREYLNEKITIVI